MTRRSSRSRNAAHESTDPDFFFGESSHRRTRRKDAQLCGQVQGAVGAALGADFDDPVLSALWVVKVEPAPTAARLLVWVAGPTDLHPNLILERVQRIASALRSEVAASIHRKRAPQLLFAVHLAEGDE